MARSQENQTRISCRVQPALKAKVEAAASLTGLSISSFTEIALSEKAEAVLTQEERIVLSQQTFEAFAKAVQAPPDKPSQRLKNAVKLYKRTSGT